MSTQAATLARHSESLDMPMLAIALPLLLVSLVLSGLGAIAAHALARQALLGTAQAKTVTV